MKALDPKSVPYRSFSRSINTGFLFFLIGVFASPGGIGANLLVIGGMVLVGIAIGIVYELAYYKRFRYELTSDTFDVTSGVISRRNREVPLRRVQNVDVRQNVLQRVLGIAAVHVESAGGGQTEITLQYVDENEAKHLQRILRRKSVEAPDAGDGERDAAADKTEVDREEAADEKSKSDRRVDREFDHERSLDREYEGDEELLFEIQPRELAILSIFTIDPGASLLGAIALSFASGFDPTTLVPTGPVEGGLPGTGLFALAWAILLFLLAAWILSMILTFNRYYGFRLVRIEDELHYERGLLQRYSGTIPLDKVQTVTVTESVPFRWFGYAALAVETAGYAPGQSGSRGTESAIPLAERPRVFQLARSVEPFGPVDLEPIPRRARERYAVRYAAVVSILMGVGYGALTVFDVDGNWVVAVALFALVPIAAHFKWANRGYHLGERYFFARTGVVNRSTKIVPYYRVQAVIYTQTIFQRRRRLASVTADTASSASLLGRAATAHDVDGERGLEIHSDVEERLQRQLRIRRNGRDEVSAVETDVSDGATVSDGTDVSNGTDTSVGADTSGGANTSGGAGRSSDENISCGVETSGEAGDSTQTDGSRTDSRSDEEGTTSNRAGDTEETDSMRESTGDGEEDDSSINRQENDSST